MFYIALLFGVIIVAIHTIEVAAFVHRVTPSIFKYSTSTAGISIFFSWIGVDGYYYGATLFSIVWPLLAAMPYGWSFADDRYDGKGIQIITRCSRQQYFWAKYIAVFVSGGLAVAMPMVLDMLVLAMFCPYTEIGVLSQNGPVNFNFLASLYYTHSWVYAFIWCGIDFLCGGVTAGLCLLSKINTKRRIWPVLLPFAILFLLESLKSAGLNISIFGNIIDPIYLARPVPNTGSANPGETILVFFGFLFVVSVCVGYWKVTKRELV